MLPKLADKRADHDYKRCLKPWQAEAEHKRGDQSNSEMERLIQPVFVLPHQTVITPFVV
jgi:hypothetical protein